MAKIKEYRYGQSNEFVYCSTPADLLREKDPSAFLFDATLLKVCEIFLIKNGFAKTENGGGNTYKTQPHHSSCVGVKNRVFEVSLTAEEVLLSVLPEDGKNVFCKHLTADLFFTEYYNKYLAASPARLLLKLTHLLKTDGWKGKIKE